MTESNEGPRRAHDEEAALRTILEGTATEMGERFFSVLVKNLAKALNTHGAWVTEYLPDSRRLRALAYWMDNGWVQDYEICIDGTPCAVVVESKRLVHYEENIVGHFPLDKALVELGAVSYMGASLLDLEGNCMGHIAVLDTLRMPEEPRLTALFQIFAARATAELQRLRAESALREREEKLSRLVDSAMDAIVELDGSFCVTHMNPAAEKVFGCDLSVVLSTPFGQFLAPEGLRKLSQIVNDMDHLPDGQRYLWIPGGFEARRRDGQLFTAEATLSRYEISERRFYSLFLRNVDDRIEAEKKIESLSSEAEYLKEEIREILNFGEIVGQSEPIQRLLTDIKQVSATDATVLIQGETGTGKELVARAIHRESTRCDGPLIKVNCAAIPSALMESEFFGHEAGAFTGATSKREGRFALADGGTIFLDEVGELPLDLQVKLLRVLQEGEFEPVGSSTTQKVDVRVLSATNRDLNAAYQEGNFRGDLYYRLNVFPIVVPPLRERGNDIALLASIFIEQAAHRMGRPSQLLTDESIRRLNAYAWPGNVRELQNVIERALITSGDGQPNLDRALPEASDAGDISQTASFDGTNSIRTAKEFQAMERQNIIRALHSTEWRVSGARGAATLLGLKASTLSSRMKALGIERPS